MTLYLKGTGTSPAAVARWTAAGHEISSHFDDTAEALQPTVAGMQAVASASVAEHQRVYQLVPRTVRNHWIVWVGWSEQAEIEASCGIGLDCNYYHYDRGSFLGDYLGEVGNFTGSGIPMKFSSADGSVLNIYQSLTQLPDEQWLQERFFSGFKTQLDPEPRRGGVHLPERQLPYGPLAGLVQKAGPGYARIRSRARRTRVDRAARAGVPHRARDHLFWRPALGGWDAFLYRQRPRSRARPGGFAPIPVRRRGIGQRQRERSGTGCGQADDQGPRIWVVRSPRRGPGSGNGSLQGGRYDKP